jgi:sulfite reductase alpha subunit-like flavoprotein
MRSVFNSALCARHASRHTISLKQFSSMSIVCEITEKNIIFLTTFHTDGSQTGTAAMFADQLAQDAKKTKWDVRCLKPLDEALQVLTEPSDVVVLITSVFGEGVPPDNAKKFYSSIMSPEKPAVLFGTKFAVFGLGK